MRAGFLRKKYPKFIYRNYTYKISGGNLKISFLFEVPPDIKFEPQITIKNIPRSDLINRACPKAGEVRDKNGVLSEQKTALDNLVFHLGLIEIPSYWKATCSPEIIIKAGYLNKAQIKWWKDLIIKGMGQFFYQNKIDFREPNFLKIFSKNNNATRTLLATLKNRVLVPIGGGKDSIVTLEKLIAEASPHLPERSEGCEMNKVQRTPPRPASRGSAKERGEKIGCFLVNPTKAMRDIVKVAGIKDSVIIKREIDPALLELNKKGFLNGHTPITAVLSFLSVFAAVLFNYKNIAFSNEKSADEGNVRYLEKTINHQWSKSSEFEKKFRKYLSKYLTSQVDYFSYLRGYTELEIAKMFTKYPKYFPVFSSCNVVLAKKLKKRWCGNCPKCLFVYATLYPFLEREQLLKIFGTDIFENKKLLPAMKGLINLKMAKPFECVGTKKESLIAFYLSWKKCRGRTSAKLPLLLKYFEKKILKSLSRRISSVSERFLRGWNTQNNSSKE